jgi:hypothetical protein
MSNRTAWGDRLRSIDKRGSRRRRRPRDSASNCAAGSVGNALANGSNEGPSAFATGDLLIGRRDVVSLPATFCL